jgi:DNA (cytosine-5)-methyltransferase 1
LNELALFAGAGGGILGGHLLGWRTVCAVEWEPYPASVLCARQNDGLLPPFPIWDDIQTFDGNPWRGIVDVVSGGFPCQDISAAGKGAGIDGERSGMWGEMARVIREVRPRFVFVENSPMLTSRGLGRVLGDLASMGFDARWGVLGAADVGANHQRDRIWIVAKWRGQLPHTQHNRIRRWEQQQEGVKESSRKLADTIGIGLETTRSELKTTRVSGSGENVANTEELFSNGGNDNAGISMEREAQSKFGNDCGSKTLAYANPDSASELAYTKNSGNVWRNWVMGFAQEEHNHRGGQSNGRREWWQAEPDVGRVADGVAARVDRLKAIGNGQVSLCAATAWRTLIELF